MDPIAHDQFQTAWVSLGLNQHSPNLPKYMVSLEWTNLVVWCNLPSPPFREHLQPAGSISTRAQAWGVSTHHICTVINNMCLELFKYVSILVRPKKAHRIPSGGDPVSPPILFCKHHIVKVETWTTMIVIWPLKRTHCPATGKKTNTHNRTPGKPINVNALLTHIMF